MKCNYRKIEINNFLELIFLGKYPNIIYKDLL